MACLLKFNIYLRKNTKLTLHQVFQKRKEKGKEKEKIIFIFTF